MGLEFAEVLMEIEENYGFSLRDDVDFSRTVTVGNFVDVICGELTRAGLEFSRTEVLKFSIKTFEDKYRRIWNQQSISEQTVIKNL